MSLKTTPHPLPLCFMAAMSSREYVFDVVEEPLVCVLLCWAS
jgi:hypothetical protein